MQSAVYNRKMFFNWEAIAPYIGLTCYIWFQPYENIFNKNSSQIDITEQQQTVTSSRFCNMDRNIELYNAELIFIPIC